MHIVYIENCRLPTEKAHGHQITSIVKAFTHLPTSTQLVIPARANAISASIYEYYKLQPEDVSVLSLPVIDLLHRADSPFSKKLAFLVIRISFSLSLILRPRIWWRQIIYTRDPFIAGLFSRIGAKAAFFEVHQRTYLRSTIQHWIRRVSGLIPVTEYMRKELETIFPSMPSVTAPDAVDSNIFTASITKQEARQKLSLSSDAFIVCYGGALTTMGASKGLGFLYKACAEAQKHIPTLQLFFVGGTREQLIQGEGLPRQDAFCTCISKSPMEVLILYYKAADVLVLPFPRTPHYEYAMSPLKLFEYMASGTTILSSDLISVREILDDNSAYWYEPESLSSCVAQLSSIFDHPEEAQRRAANSYTLSKKYTWDQRARLIVEFIERVTATKTP